jgi:heptosyltransferase-3
MSLGAGLPRLDGQPNLVLPPAAGCNIDALKLPARYVAVHARSNEESRNWSAARWNELVENLVSRFDLKVVEIGLDPALEAGRKNVVNLCGHLSLIETAEVVRRATYYIGIDSGPAHFANAFQIPSVILLGHYRAFHRYMPYTGFLRDHADKMVIHWGGPASEIPVAEVIRRFEDLCRTKLVHA